MARVIQAGGASDSASDSHSTLELPRIDNRRSKGFVLGVEGPAQGVGVVELHPTLGIVRP